MSETRKISHNKKPFEIFTHEEITNLKHCSQHSSYLQDLLNKLTLTMNEGIHNKTIGWHSKMISSLYSEPLDDNQKADIKKSLDCYIEAANRLQKNKTGSVESITLPTSKKTIEKFVNVYHNFWQDCVEKLILTFIANITAKTQKELQDGIGKSYVYCLYQLNKIYLLNLKLDMSRKNRIQACVSKTIRHITALCHLEAPFLLSEDEIKQAHLFRDDLFLKYLMLNDLRRMYESLPGYARYIHLCPAITIQFAQLLNYVIQKITNKLTLTKNEQQVLIILENKRKEFADTIAFQEKLQLLFDIDDYILTLAFILSNKQNHVVPNQNLINYLNSHESQVVCYPEDDACVPKKIDRLHYSQWRMAYIELYANKQDKADVALNGLTEWRIKQEPQEIKAENMFLFKQKTVALIEADEVKLIKVPDFVASYLANRQLDDHLIQEYQEDKLSSPFQKLLSKSIKFIKNEVDRSHDELFDFFINKKHEREECYNLSRYQDDMDFLIRQVEHKAEPYVFFKGTDKANEFTDVTINNFSALKDIIVSIEKELLLASHVQYSSLHAKIIMQAYIDKVKESQSNILKNAKRIISYWQNRLRESGQFDKVKMLIEDFNTILPEEKHAGMTVKKCKCSRRYSF